MMRVRLDLTRRETVLSTMSRYWISQWAAFFMPPRESPATPASARGRGRTVEEFDVSKDTRVVVQRHDVTFESRAKALAGLPPVVYAVRIGETIKIGHSAEMHNRLRKYGADAKLLGYRPGRLSDEKVIHAALRAHRAHGREFYHPTAEVLAVVEAMRADLGLPSLTIRR